MFVESATWDVRLDVVAVRSAKALNVLKIRTEPSTRDIASRTASGERVTECITKGKLCERKRLTSIKLINIYK